MLELLLYGLLMLVLVPVAIGCYRLAVGYRIYCKIVKAYGASNVLFVNRAFELFKALLTKPPDSIVLFTELLRSHPNTKLIVVSLLQTVYVLVCDAELIRKLTTEFSRFTPKWTMLIFGEATEKGLLFSHGETWRKSRSIISNLFHFGELKAREHTMHEVVERHLQNLNSRQVDLFRLGCDIGGEIVIETLFGKEFAERSIDGLPPLQYAQSLIAAQNAESLKPLHLLRASLVGKVTMDSNWLTAKQKLLRNQHLRLMEVSTAYLQQQKLKREKKQPVPPFIDAYLALNNDSYLDQVVQQLILFLIAGQQTTGELIEMCLYALAEHPEYQEKLLEALQTNPDVHTNKPLNNFIQEVNRLFGPVRFSLVRQIEESFVVDGFEFEKGIPVRLAFGLCMTNIRYFDRPGEFVPERFDKPLEYPQAYTPFSGGPHNCIGQHMAMMEVRVAVSAILKRYRLERTAVPLKMVTRPVLTSPAKHNLVRFAIREAAK